MIIIGIDPGTARTGYGVIKKMKRKENLRCLDFGVIETNPNLSDGLRLQKLVNQISKLIRKHKPDFLAIEKLYFFKNLKTAIPVAQAKGAILYLAAKKKIPVYEFTPLEVKTAVTNYGKADKKQVQRMIKVLLNLKEVPSPDDAADALGVAVCCANLIK